MNEKSLITQAAQEALTADSQFEMWFGSELPKIDRATPIGDYTGERFFERRPRDYKLCVDMCGDPTIRTRKICELLHVNRRTVEGVREREATLVAGAHQTLLTRLKHTITHAVEVADEKLDEANAVQAATVAGILTDKHAMLSGNATAILEIKHTGGDNFARYQELFAKVKELANAQREKLVQATVIGSEAVENA